MRLQGQKLNVKNLEANRCSATAKKIPGLAAHGWTSFHGFTTYWVIKKAPSCTVHSVENTASYQRDGVGKYTMPTVSTGEADQTSQQCRFVESHAAALEVQVCQQRDAVLG